MVVDQDVPDSYVGAGLVLDKAEVADNKCHEVGRHLMAFMELGSYLKKYV